MSHAIIDININIGTDGETTSCGTKRKHEHDAHEHGNEENAACRHKEKTIRLDADDTNKGDHATDTTMTTEMTTTTSDHVPFAVYQKGGFDFSWPPPFSKPEPIDELASHHYELSEEKVVFRSPGTASDQ